MNAFSFGAYVDLSNAILTVEGICALTVTVISFDVAVAAATVDASITLSLAVHTVSAVTGQRIRSVAFHAAH